MRLRLFEIKYSYNWTQYRQDILGGMDSEVMEKPIQHEMVLTARVAALTEQLAILYLQNRCQVYSNFKILNTDVYDLDAIIEVKD